jgi:hypothetical protein
MKKSTKHQNPTPSEVKSAFKLWMSGGKSIWQVKRETGFKARVLVPLFEKLSGKKIKSPAQKMPVKGAKKEGVRRAA